VRRTERENDHVALHRGRSQGMSAIPENLSSALPKRYQLERLLGRGGIATVYLADDLRHGAGAVLGGAAVWGGGYSALRGLFQRKVRRHFRTLFQLLDRLSRYVLISASRAAPP
jgi:drug/metabolite transporter (DMT)-like permease